MQVGKIHITIIWISFSLRVVTVVLGFEILSRIFYLQIIMLNNSLAQILILLMLSPLIFVSQNKVCASKIFF